jgi:hypothetical protein
MIILIFSPPQKMAEKIGILGSKQSKMMQKFDLIRLVSQDIIRITCNYLD